MENTETHDEKLRRWFYRGKTPAERVESLLEENEKLRQENAKLRRIIENNSLDKPLFRGNTL